MAIVVVFEAPGFTQAQYEQAADKVTGGHGLPKSPSDFPVPGLLSHTAAPTPDGWLVVEVWESEEAFRRFGETLMPILAEIGPVPQPKVYPVHNMVPR